MPENAGCSSDAIAAIGTAAGPQSGPRPSVSESRSRLRRLLPDFDISAPRSPGLHSCGQYLIYRNAEGMRSPLDALSAVLEPKAMPIWRLIPVDLTDPNWEASSHHAPVVVRARHAERARAIAQRAFGAPSCAVMVQKCSG